MFVLFSTILCHLFGYHIFSLSLFIHINFLSLSLIFSFNFPFYFKTVLFVLTSFIRFCMLYPCGTGFILLFVFPSLFSPADEQLPSLNRVVEQESGFLINPNIFLWRSISFIPINTNAILVQLPYNSS